MNDLEQLKKLTGEKDEELLTVVLDGAKSECLLYMNRSKIPKAVNPAVIRLAVVRYNQLGTEGETSRSEAGINSSFVDMPENVKEILKRYRLARVGGKTFEA